jgi:hypothetical protein
MYSLYAVFPQSQICRQRQYAALIRWSAYNNALPVPTEKPDEQWVARRVLGESIPANPEYYVNVTMSYTVAVPNVQTNIRTHLSSYNDEAVEAAMDAEVDGAVSSYIDQYARTAITQQQIDNWYAKHGFETAPAS